MTCSFSYRTSCLRHFLQSDLYYDFTHSPIAIISFFVMIIFAITAIFAPILAPTNPLNLASLDLMNANLPPAWYDGANIAFPLGTDDQGRDLLSAIIYGLRLSLIISLISVALSLLIGISLGLLSGYVGGSLDTFIMRLCDVMLSFPAILIALLVDGIARVVLPSGTQQHMAYGVLILAMTLSGWVQYARVVRGLTLVESRREYVDAARLAGASRLRIMATHVLPNVMSPILALATVHIGTAVITEATLSFLGVGVPPTTPSLGTLIRIGNEFLFSGEWWICIFPGMTLALFVLSVNLFGDWLRDSLNPQLHG